MFARIFYVIAAVFAWQLLLSCAEGGGTGLIEPYTPDATVPVVVQDTGPPEGRCGDGEKNSDDEQCDGDDLDGMSCSDLGEGTGTLACYPESCTFDVTMCHEPEEEDAAAAGAAGSYGSGGSAGGN